MRGRPAPLSMKTARRAFDALLRVGPSHLVALRLGALSMRRLGSALGAKAMSLYNHVANKDHPLVDESIPAGRQSAIDETRVRVIEVTVIALLAGMNNLITTDCGINLRLPPTEPTQGKAEEEKEREEGKKAEAIGAHVTASTDSDGRVTFSHRAAHRW